MKYLWLCIFIIGLQGCTTPEAIKQAQYDTLGAVDAAITLDNGLALPHLKCAKKNAIAVQTFLGIPENPQEYEVNAASDRAEVAQQIATLRAELDKKITGIVTNPFSWKDLLTPETIVLLVGLIGTGAFVTRKATKKFEKKP